MLDAGSRILLKDGAIVRLTPKAFDTLLVLVQHKGQLVDKEQLLKDVWPDSYVEEGSLSRNIHELRKVLGDHSSEPRYIETIPKRGYRFVAPLKVPAPEESQVAAEPELPVAAPGPRPSTVDKAQKRWKQVALVLGVLLGLLTVRRSRFRVIATGIMRSM